MQSEMSVAGLCHYTLIHPPDLHTFTFPPYTKDTQLSSAGTEHRLPESSNTDVIPYGYWAAS